MATFKSTTATALDAAAAKAGSYIASAALVSGRLVFAQATLTVPAGVAASDIFELCDIPAGATLIPALCNIVPLAAAGAGELIVGYTGDTSALSGATKVAVATAGVKNYTPDDASVTLTERKRLIATTDDALTEGVVIVFNFVYAMGQ